jgi:Trypsin-like peptidase domain
MIRAEGPSRYRSGFDPAARSRSNYTSWLWNRQGQPQMSIFSGWRRSRNFSAGRDVSLFGTIRRFLFFIGVQVGLLPCAGAACIDPSTLLKTTVSISRDFGVEERKLTPGIAGIDGTGWFLSPRLLVTAAHVAEAMRLSLATWKEIEIWDGKSKTIVATRVHDLAGPQFEKMALLDLMVPFSGAVALSVRREPLLPEERVVALAYPNSRLRFAGGRFVAYGADQQFPGAALMEIYEGNDRLVLDHGASGAPVLDCQGRVVAVVSSILTQTLRFRFGAVQVSTAWQTPNVISMPADVLRGFVLSE